VPSSSPTGDCLVFFIVNGNNLLDHNAPTAFEEPRPFLFAPVLPGGHSIETPLEIGSNNPSGPPLGFADYAILDLSGWSDYSEPIMGGVTPGVPADRDCLFDDDTATPNLAHIVFFEQMRDPDDGKQTIWRTRTIDLRPDTFATAESRIFPPLAERPAAIGTGNNATGFGATDRPFFYVATRGDSVLVCFNEVWGGSADPGFIYVNTFDPDTRRWSRAALISHDYPGPIGNRGGDSEMLLVPGVNSGACDGILGGWIFWMRSITQPEGGENDVDLLQGRRIFDLNLPE
jgi:hypothetical protein